MLPDTTVLHAVRAQLEQAHDHTVTACAIFRRAGWPETADELMRAARLLQTWTQRDGGWLHYLETEAASGAAGGRRDG